MPLEPFHRTTSIYAIRDNLLLSDVRCHLLWLGDAPVKGIPSGLVIYAGYEDINPTMVVMRPAEEGGLWEWFELPSNTGFQPRCAASAVGNFSGSSIATRLVTMLEAVKERRKKNAV